MSTHKEYSLSIVVPLYNESEGLDTFHHSLLQTLEQNNLDSFEVIYVDDGSTDRSSQVISTWSKDNDRVKLIRLSRNFGKENALTAGIVAASGQAIILIDGDGQHPVELIPKFVEEWRSGSRVVVGLRTNESGENAFKRTGSNLFYKLFNRMSGNKLAPGSTDFRLIDASVQKEFIKLSESDRITRGLIDWLGFEQSFISFESNARTHGTPGYSHRKLMQLAVSSIVSSSSLPLYAFGYLGIFITVFAMLFGLTVFIEQFLLSDPLAWDFSGTAMLSILLLFLVGIILMSQGLLSLYISHIHNQSKKRPLYVIDYKNSVGIGNDTD